MKNEKKTLTLTEIWQQAHEIFRATRPQILALALAGVALPQLVLSLIFAAWSGRVVRELRALFAALTAGSGPVEGVSYHKLVAPALPYVSWLTLGLFSVFVVMLASYFAMTDLAVRQRRAMELPSPGRAFAKGLGLVAKGGLVLAVLLFAFITLGQVLILPAVLLSALSLMVPVVWIAEQRGVLRSLGHALTLRYTRLSPYSGWNVLFALFTLAAIFYAGLITISLATEKILLLDLWSGLPRSLFTLTFPGVDFGSLFVVVTLLEALAMAIVVAALPLLTTAAYFIVKRKREITIA